MESKNRSSLLNVISLAVAVISLAASAFFAHKSRNLENELMRIQNELMRIQQATLRPILIPTLEELSFDRNYIKIILSIANRGPTTAVIKDARITTYDQDGVSAWIPGFTETIIYPGSTRRRTFKLSRRTTVSIAGTSSTVTYDPGNTITAMGKLPFLVTFESQQLPGIEFTEALLFTDLPWHNKSIIGVGD